MATYADILNEMSNLTDLGVELTDEQNAELEIMMAELCQMESDKIDSTAEYIKKRLADAEFLKQESKLYALKAKRIENGIERLKNYYTIVMQKHKKTKVEGAKYSLSLRKSSSVSIFVPTEKLAPKYRNIKTEVVPDKNAIKEALKNGVEVDGCSLVEKQSLQIKN